MGGVRSVAIRSLPLARFEPLIGADRYGSLEEVAVRARRELAGVTVWNVNTTSSGGGVAEMLKVLVGYGLGAGIDVRWLVIAGDERFFDTTKRLHNHLHGFPGEGEITEEAAEHYRGLTDERGAELAGIIRPGDIVLLHDPQTAGMSTRLAAAGAHLVWRCHVGVDGENEWTRSGWDFLQPHLEHVRAFVFSRRSYAPSFIPGDAVVVIPPSIDPFAPKNADLTDAEVRSILAAAGIIASKRVPGMAPDPARAWTAISHRARLVADGSIDPSTPLVTQVSRWDRLKDMSGVMEAFVDALDGMAGAHLALVGPEVSAVSDDPEGAVVLAECTAAWSALPKKTRRRVSLVSLPMANEDENAVMVNAVQRHATIVVQKSLAEGFGLTVAEAMWKARPVVASRVGGITDQLAAGTGILIDDPRDLVGFAAALSRLLADPGETAKLGQAARRHVLEDFLGDRHLAAYASLMGQLLAHHVAEEGA